MNEHNNCNGKDVKQKNIVKQIASITNNKPNHMHKNTKQIASSMESWKNLKPLCIPNNIKIQHLLRNQRCQHQFATMQITTCIVGMILYATIKGPTCCIHCKKHLQLKELSNCS